MYTIVLPIKTIIDRLLALSVIRGAVDDRDRAHLGHRHEAALRALIPLVVSRIAQNIATGSSLECTDTEIIYTGAVAISADTLAMVVISMAQHMLGVTTDGDVATLPADTILPPEISCHWY